MNRTFQVNEFNLCLLQQMKYMRHVLNGSLKECKSKRRIDKTRTKLRIKGVLIKQEPN